MDVQKATLTGSGTFHGMGIILSHKSTFSVNCQGIKKKKVTKADILKHSIKLKQFKKECTIKDLELKSSMTVPTSFPQTTSGLVTCCLILVCHNYQAVFM